MEDARSKVGDRLANLRKPPRELASVRTRRGDDEVVATMPPRFEHYTAIYLVVVTLFFLAVILWFTERPGAMIFAIFAAGMLVLTTFLRVIDGGRTWRVERHHLYYEVRGVTRSVLLDGKLEFDYDLDEGWLQIRDRDGQIAYLPIEAGDGVRDLLREIDARLAPEEAEALRRVWGEIVAAFGWTRAADGY